MTPVGHGVIRRESGQVRLRVALDTKAKTLCPFVERFTHSAALVFTDDYGSYNPLRLIFFD